MPRPSLSLAVVGAEHPNKRGPGRRFGITLCQPGDPVQLVREPKNPFDENAIAVFGRDIQLGYIRSERAAWLAPLIDRGTEVVAIFQHATGYGAAIRVAFEGEVPTIPPSPTFEDVLDAPDFYPDPEWPDE